ncbi:MAG: transcription termination/antitermination NusG family protein [Bryobacterales bacterium]
MTTATTRDWYALVVKPQHEKRVAESLRLKGFEEFFPYYHASRQWGRKRRTVSLPLFPQYVFSRFALSERLGVLEIPSVRGIVKFQGRPAPVDPFEVDRVRALIRHANDVSPHPFLNVGCTVRVRQGPLAGVTGILARFKQRHRLVVSVTLLGRSVAVEIDQAAVEVVKAGPIPVISEAQLN